METQANTDIITNICMQHSCQKISILRQLDAIDIQETETSHEERAVVDHYKKIELYQDNQY